MVASRMAGIPEKRPGDYYIARYRDRAGVAAPRQPPRELFFRGAKQSVAPPQRHS